MAVGREIRQHKYPGHNMKLKADEKGATKIGRGTKPVVSMDLPCCVEAECHFHYLGDSGLYMYTKAAAWATAATVATPLPMWGGEGSGMVP
jgi:hypothetical protein